MNNIIKKLGSGSVSGFETDRIATLNHIVYNLRNELELLTNERNLLANQLKDAHRNNLILTRSIDENKENIDAANGMKERIESLNNAISDLRREKCQLEKIVKSYAIGIANEHNYSLNREL